MSTPTGIKIGGASPLVRPVTTAPAAAPAAPSSPAYSKREDAMEKDKDFDQRANWRAKAISTPSQSAQAGDLLELTRKVMSDYNIPGCKLSAELVSGTTYGLLFSTVVVRLSAGSSHAVYMLAAEGSFADGRYPDAVVKVANSGEVSVARGPMDALGGKYAKTLTDHVLAGLPHGDTLIYVGNTYVPREWDCGADTSVNVRTKVVGLIVNAIAAVAAEFTEQRGEQPINLATWLQPGEILEAAVSFGNEPRPNALGVPTRTDVIIDLRTAVTGRTAVRERDRDGFDFMDLNTTKGGGTLASIGGWLQAEWMPETGEVVRDSEGRILPRPLAARLILSNLVSTEAKCLSLTTLAVATAAVMRQSSIWWHGFKPRYNATQAVKDATNVGALDVLVNLAERMTPRTAMGDIPYGEVQRLGSDAEWDFFMNASFQQRLAIGLLVPAADPESWALDPFLRSALGDPDSDALIAGLLNWLTNNKFADYYDGGSICLPYSEQVQTGTYTGSDGMPRPIEDVDLTAVCARFGKQQPDGIVAWMNAVNDANTSFARSAASRATIRDTVLGVPSKVRGTATIVMLRGHVLDAAQRAMDAAKVSPRVIAPGLAAIDQRRQGARWGDALLDSRTYGRGRGGDDGGGSTLSLRSRAFRNA